MRVPDRKGFFRLVPSEQRTHRADAVITSAKLAPILSQQQVLKDVTASASVLESRDKRQLEFILVRVENAVDVGGSRFTVDDVMTLRRVSKLL